MTTRQIERDDLNNYLDSFSTIMPAELVEIEVAALDIGDQIEAEWAPLSGITYDPKDDVVVVDIDDSAVEHMIRSPQEFTVDEDDNGIHSFSIRDSEGRLHIIKLKEPKALPKVP